MAPRIANCQRCREKKLRCDRRTPCSSCYLRKASCAYTALADAKHPSTFTGSDLKAGRLLLSKLSDCERELSSIKRLLTQHQGDVVAEKAEHAELRRAIDALPPIAVLRSAFQFYLDRINHGFYALDPETSMQNLEELWHILTSFAQDDEVEKLNKAAIQISIAIALAVYAVSSSAGFDPEAPDRRQFSVAHDYGDIYSTITWLYDQTKDRWEADMDSLRLNLLLCTLTNCLHGPKETNKLLLYTFRLVSHLRLDYEPDLTRMPTKEANDRVQLFVAACCLDWMSTPFYKPFIVLREDPINYPSLFGPSRISLDQRISTSSDQSVFSEYLLFKLMLAQQSKRAFERKFQSAEQVVATDKELRETSIELDGMVSVMLESRAEIKDPLERCLQQSSLRILVQMQDFLFHRGAMDVTGLVARQHALAGIAIFADLLHELARSVEAMPLKDDEDVEVLVKKFPGLWQHIWLTVEFSTVFLVFYLHVCNRADAQRIEWNADGNVMLVNSALRLLRGKAMDDLDRSLGQLLSLEHRHVSEYGSSLLVAWLTDQITFA